jgi:hypothetical protein
MSKVAKSVSVTFEFPIQLNKNAHITSGWFYPEIAIKNKWYLVLYFGDTSPYVSKYDGNYWRDSEGRVMAVPMFVIPVPDAPPPRKKDKSASAD